MQGLGRVPRSARALQRSAQRALSLEGRLSGAHRTPPGRNRCRTSGLLPAACRGQIPRIVGFDGGVALRTRILGVRCLAVLAEPDRSFAVTGLREVLFDSSRTPLSGRADAVWTAYRALAGSTKDLTAADIKSVAFRLSEAVLELARTGSSDQELRSLAEEASARVRAVAGDAAAAGIPVSSKVVAWYLHLCRICGTLGDYAACAKVVDFVHSCGASLGGAWPSLLKGLAVAGNYTAFLAILFRAASHKDIGPLPLATVPYFIAAIVCARHGSSENLTGYPAVTGAAADLRIRPPSSEPLIGSQRQHPMTEDGPDPMEVAEDPEAALRAYLASGEAERIADLSRPGMPVGTITRARKLLELLSLVARQQRDGRLRGPVPLQFFVKALLEGGNPRLARAALNILYSEPYSVPPSAAHYEPLLEHAELAGDEAVVGLAEDLERRGAQPSPDDRMSFISAYGNLRQWDRVREQFVALVAEGGELDSGDVATLVDALVGSAATGEQAVEAMALLAGAGIPLNADRWNQALLLVAERGDAAAVSELWGSIPEPEYVQAGTAVEKLCQAAGDYKGAVAVLRTLPASMLWLPWVWAYALDYLGRRMRPNDDPAPVIAICRALFTGTAIDSGDLFAPAAEALPFAGIAPPPLVRHRKAVLRSLVNALAACNRLYREQRREMEELARQALVRAGFEAEGLGLLEMQDVVWGKLSGWREAQRVAESGSSDAGPGDDGAAKTGRRRAATLPAELLELLELRSQEASEVPSEEESTANQTPSKPRRRRRGPGSDAKVLVDLLEDSGKQSEEHDGSNEVQDADLNPPPRDRRASDRISREKDTGNEVKALVDLLEGARSRANGQPEKASELLDGQEGGIAAEDRRPKPPRRVLADLVGPATTAQEVARALAAVESAGIPVGAGLWTTALELLASRGDPAALAELASLVPGGTRVDHKTIADAIAGRAGSAGELLEWVRPLPPRVHGHPPFWDPVMARLRALARSDRNDDVEPAVALLSAFFTGGPPGAAQPHGSARDVGPCPGLALTRSGGKRIWPGFFNALRIAELLPEPHKADMEALARDALARAGFDPGDAGREGLEDFALRTRQELKAARRAARLADAGRRDRAAPPASVEPTAEGEDAAGSEPRAGAEKPAVPEALVGLLAGAGRGTAPRADAGSRRRARSRAPVPSEEARTDAGGVDGEAAGAPSEAPAVPQALLDLLGSALRREEGQRWDAAGEGRGEGGGMRGSRRADRRREHGGEEEADVEEGMDRV